MAAAIILTVDDDIAVSQAITRDLRARYGQKYRVARATSGAEALTALHEFARRDQQVAMIVSDHRMPGMTGIELHEQAMRSPPAPSSSSSPPTPTPTPPSARSTPSASTTT